MKRYRMRKMIKVGMLVALVGVTPICAMISNAGTNSNIQGQDTFDEEGEEGTEDDRTEEDGTDDAISDIPEDTTERPGETEEKDPNAEGSKEEEAASGDGSDEKDVETGKEDSEGEKTDVDSDAGGDRKELPDDQPEDPIKDPEDEEENIHDHDDTENEEDIPVIIAFDALEVDTYSFTEKPGVEVLWERFPKQLRATVWTERADLDQEEDKEDNIDVNDREDVKIRVPVEWGYDGVYEEDEKEEYVFYAILDEEKYDIQANVVPTILVKVGLKEQEIRMDGAVAIYRNEEIVQSYASLALAVEELEDGDILRLNEDQEIGHDEERISIRKDITLDLNGYTLTLKKAIVTDHDIRITGPEEEPGKILAIDNAGILRYTIKRTAYGAFEEEEDEMGAVESGLIIKCCADWSNDPN